MIRKYICGIRSKIESESHKQILKDSFGVKSGNGNVDFPLPFNIVYFQKSNSENFFLKSLK